jgi:hypothetical protein
VPLKKILIKPGTNRENTRYTQEGSWYESDKVRFRQGTPEKIGGWQRINDQTFLGVCRSLYSWTTLASRKYIGVGTNLKFYVTEQVVYSDITPIRSTGVINANPFATTDTLTTVTVTDTAHGAIVGDFVTFSGAAVVAGLDLNAEYQITVVLDGSTYQIEAASAANATVAAGGGAVVNAAYQINTGPAAQLPAYGWAAGYWGSNAWGNSAQASGVEIRLWSQSNYGEDLVIAPRYGAIYYWDASVGTTQRAYAVTSMGGASDVPTIVQVVLVSDASRFTIAFGCNEQGSSSLDPMLVRWSDQEDISNWTPSATNQAGSYRLSRGSEIYAALQARQEILIWTDIALYAMQYLGAPAVWGFSLLEDNVSCGRPNGVVVASGVV